jgi:hypothetical protein
MKKKATGEGEFLDSILESREHTSFISGLPIEGGRPNCAHVLPKGAYPELKYDPENIVLLTWKEHQLFDQGTEQDRNNYHIRMLAQGCEVNWQKLYELKEQLFHEKSK